MTVTRRRGDPWISDQKGDDMEKLDYSPREFWISTLSGVAAGVVLMLIGYALCVSDQGSIGVVMFALVPLATGLVVAMIASDLWRIASCVMATVMVSLSALFFIGLEGIICVFMASPIIFAMMAVGAVLGYVVKLMLTRWMPGLRQKLMILLMLLTFPMLFGMASHLEKPYRETESLATFSSHIDLPVSPDEAWRLLAQMQPLDGPRPFLIRRGLPLPVSCELESESVGAKRICHFDQGRIEQTITAWEPGRHMAIRVDRSTLPGRLWLRFDSAAYDLQAIEGGTRVIRHTTIGSKLYPRWYWQPLERWGVLTEHQFVLGNIERWAASQNETPQSDAADVAKQ
jgi:hypothetical protein